MLVDFSAVANCIVGFGGTCLEKPEGSETKKLILGQGIDLPFVTLKLVRGTTALEVNAPPDHYSVLGIMFRFIGMYKPLCLTFWQSVQWHRAAKYVSASMLLALDVSWFEQLIYLQRRK